MVAWSMVLVASLLERLSLRLAGFRLRVVTGAALVGITLFAFFGAWHLHRYLVPPRKGDVRVVYWNLSVDRQTGGTADAVLAHSPDIAIIANPRTDQYRTPLFEALGTLGGKSIDQSSPPPAIDEPGNTDLNPDEDDPKDATDITTSIPSDTHLLFRSELLIATKGNITRYALARFDLGSDEPEDRGVILFVEITGLSTEPLGVWVVDLPSSPLRSRKAITSLARSTIDEWTGPIFSLDSIGRWTPSAEQAGFPTPDLIVGDFNTPRGSASLESLTTTSEFTFRESFAAVGRGLGVTWPRKGPFLGIDLFYAQDSIVIDRHRTADPGMGHHRMLIVDITPP